MEITEHIAKRYCERILNIPKNAVKEYADLHRGAIHERINEMCEDSILIYQGQIGAGNNPASFRIHNDIIICCSFEDKRAISLNRIQFDVPPSVNKKFIRALVSEVKRCQQELEKANTTANKKLDKERSRKESIEAELIKLRERINQLEEEKKSIKKRIWEIKQVPQLLEKTITDLVTKLYYSSKIYLMDERKSG